MEEVTGTETKEPSLKDLYEAVIELTKQVGNFAKELSELRSDLALKKKAGNF